MIPIILKQQFEERKVVFYDVKSFYSQRSQLVHGNDIQISTDFLETIEDYLRSSISILLDKTENESRQDIIDRLDLE
jgi:hypothetical protein